MMTGWTVDTLLWCEIDQDFKRPKKVEMIPRSLQSTFHLECGHKCTITTHQTKAFGMPIVLPSVDVSYS